MRFLHNTSIRFMHYKWLWMGISTALIVASLLLITVGPGFKFGVDFSGGTQLTLKFKGEPDLGRIRKALEELGIGTVTIQRFGEVGEHDLLIRVQNPKQQEGDFAAPMLAALDREFNKEQSAIRLNLQGSEVITNALVEANPDEVGGTVSGKQAHYKPMADAILQVRKQKGLIEGPADLTGASAVSADVRTYLSQQARFGEFSLLAADNVGPLVGKDLQSKATYAVVFSLLGMLIYIWFRFQLQYGVGAIVALIHDTIIALGALSLTGREIDIPTIAALLTLIGYSVNDTVIIFDRIRENIRLQRGKPLTDTMDMAINQTLSRTIITSGLTELVVVSLFLFGGDVINTFAFVLMLGIIVGTYSSVYVASPIALFASNWIEQRRQARRRR
ncbi:MAG TPA: protein translocase subunit SecF [Thermoanaerobaculaceae bacterium]|nr:protein translocase subunit SecF [Thermoanaerobaculaceae bacterium]HPS77465.1 protein translocase subunit SecF [Thermoanaerobaculaceae bacterium]